jgi:hypothetical protein
MSIIEESGLRRKFQLVAMGALLLAAPGFAQVSTGFEPPDYNGSPDGTSIAGQQGWYTPPVAGTEDGSVYTYDGNALGFSADPGGETQFCGGTSATLGDFVRAQKNFDFTAADVWTASWDISVNFLGTAPASNNISSFSVQDSTATRSFIAVNPYMNPDTADSWMAGWITYDASGMTIDPGGLPVAPGPEFTNLQLNHWYNESVTFDFSTGSIVSITITDLESGNTATYSPNWYLQGGAISSGPRPTAVRIFVGGGDVVLGNAAAYDNLSVEAATGAVWGQGKPAAPQFLKGKAGSITN